MTNDKSHAFRERWRELQRQKKDLDYRRSVFARDLRAAFDEGERGDGQFRDWCKDNIGEIGFRTEELLTLASAAAIVNDEKTFKAIGGGAACRHLSQLDKRQRVTVIEAAKAQHKNVYAVMRDRGLAEPKNSYRSDLLRLAEFVLGSGVKAPPEIRRIAERYAAGAVREANPPRKSAA